MRGKLKVMYAEDDEDIRMIAKMAMEMNDTLQVQDYNSGAKILENLLNVKPDIIVLDVQMPDLSGVDTLDKIKATKGFENVPVIFLTSSLGEGELALYYAVGAAGVLEKPFDPMTLAYKIINIYSLH